MPTPDEPIEQPAADGGWWTPGVRGVGFASLLSDLGHEIPTALLPSFLTSVLGAPAAALGLIEGLADGLSGIAKVAGGPLADDPDRRRTLAVGGYTATAILSALIGVAMAAWQVGLLRAGAWAARGIRTPSRNALLADAVDASAYGRAYGFERAMDNLGAVLGPLAALALVSLFDIRTAILISVLPGLLAGVAIIYAVRHLRRASVHRSSRPAVVVRPLLRGPLGRALAVISAFEVGNVAATLLILRATDLLAADGRTDATQIAIGLYVLYNVAGTVASLPFGRLGDRRSFNVVLGAGFALFVAAYVGFALGPTDPLFIGLAFVLAGVGIGAVETGEHALVATSAPAEYRGSAFGLLAGVQSLGDLLASGVVGIIWTLVGPAVAFTYAAAWMGLALVGLAITRREAS
jgi:MFS family permease